MRRVRGGLLRFVVLRVAVVLQFNIPSFGKAALAGHAVAVGGDAGGDEEREMHDAAKEESVFSTLALYKAGGELEL